jgi:hypothetical protein
MCCTCREGKAWQRDLELAVFPFGEYLMFNNDMMNKCCAKLELNAKDLFQSLVVAQIKFGLANL